MKKLCLLPWLIVQTLPAFSQEVEMADTMRSEGKIYVVVAILLVTLVGLVTYLISIDRKASRLEKKLEDIKKKLI